MWFLILLLLRSIYEFQMYQVTESHKVYATVNFKMFETTKNHRL